MRSLITHMSTSDDYPYFETKLLEYVKSGDCTPLDYSYMVDTYYTNKGKKTYYGMGRHYRNQLIPQKSMHIEKVLVYQV
jgi:lysine/ornithine N-monooxygenase